MPEKNAPKEIHLVAIYDESAASHSTVKEWLSRIKRGRLSLEDDSYPSFMMSYFSCYRRNIMKVEQMLMSNRRLRTVEIATDLGISKQSVLTIIHGKLCMSMVSSSWVPRMLTPLHKQTLSEMSQLNLDIINEDSELFFPVLLLGTKRGFTIGILRQNRNLCSGNTPHLPHPVNSRLNHQSSTINHQPGR